MVFNEFEELFADDDDKFVKSCQIYYDDDAIDRLLDREQVGDEEASLDDEEENGFLKAFKVANFDYIDKAELVAEEETPAQPEEDETSVGPSYWEDLLKDKHEVQRMEEFNSMGRRKRSGKQKMSVKEEDSAELGDEVSSDAEDDTLSDDETTSEETPLMEDQGTNLRVLGFNQRQRASFVKILMRLHVS